MSGPRTPLSDGIRDDGASTPPGVEDGRSQGSRSSRKTRSAGGHATPGGCVTNRLMPRMLDDFFQLNVCDTVKNFDSPIEFVTYFKNSKSLRHADIPTGAPIQETGFKDIEFENVRLSRATFERVTFTRCVFRDCLFVGAKFVSCEFHNCRFENCNTYKFSLKDVYIDPRSFKLDRSYRTTASNIGVYLFQELYRNASETYQTYFASFADVERRRWRRYQLRYEVKHSRGSRWATSWRITSDVIFDVTAKYGYGPMRFFLLSLLVFMLIAVVGERLWGNMGMMRSGVEVTNVTFADALYYCMLLMTTLGFSDLVPTSETGKAFTVVCALFGISWTGLFTAVLVRRLIR
jgi:ion channel/pentapeptide repeat protein